MMSKLVLGLVALGIVTAFLLGAVSHNVVLPREAHCMYVGNKELPSGDASGYSEEEVTEAQEKHESGELDYILSTGDSMMPTILNASICRCVPTGDYAVGDIVVFSFPDPRKDDYMLINHRIVQSNGTHVITKGDRNSKADGVVPVEDIICEIPQATQIELLLDRIRLEG
jgi:hypothetical protein